MSNWNYEELGFRSQKEMEESIERVKAELANPRNDLELRAANKAKFDAMNKNGGVDFKGLEEGARLAELDRIVASKLRWEKEAEKLRKEKEYWDGLMNKVAADVAADNKKKADAAIAEQLAEAEERIRKEQNKLHHVEEDSTTDKAWRQMLNPTK